MSNALRVVDTLENQSLVVAPKLSKVQQLKQYAVSKTAKFGYAVGGLTTGVSAFAEGPAAPDMSPIITMINGIVAVVGSVGMAVLSVYATAKVFKWVKTAF